MSPMAASRQWGPGQLEPYSRYYLRLLSAEHFSRGGETLGYRLKEPGLRAYCMVCFDSQCVIWLQLRHPGNL
jgi:hypothetical protein